jgi:hypothetical protein
MEEAAAKLGKTLEWVEARRVDGTIRVLKTKWASDRLYISEPMFRRLLAAKDRPKCDVVHGDLLSLEQAAFDAGVSTGTVQRWVLDGELQKVSAKRPWKVLRIELRARARVYWATTRNYTRARPPFWLGLPTSVAPRQN